MVASGDQTFHLDPKICILSVELSRVPQPQRLSEEYYVQGGLNKKEKEPTLDSCLGLASMPSTRCSLHTKKLYIITLHIQPALRQDVLL